MQMVVRQFVGDDVVVKNVKLMRHGRQECSIVPAILFQTTGAFALDPMPSQILPVQG
jgi:hypothetical protein